MIVIRRHPVRIETVAERLMENLLHDASEDDLGKAKFLPEIWVNFTDDFEREIQDAIEDDNVAGFKSVICYRTGLDIEPEYDEAAKAVGHPFERYVKNCIRKRTFRIEILSERLPHSDSLAKPFQMHTGLGDNDINLLESNPAFLQPLIENYPQVPFVLLHSAYPYTREAGYLATVYRHVYLDIGEVFPMVSRDGQRAILRQALELIPGSKLLYSSDGHWFPETYWLANTQFREVWLDVSCRHGFSTDSKSLTITASHRILPERRSHSTPSHRNDKRHLVQQLKRAVRSALRGYLRRDTAVGAQAANVQPET
jgi:hypothetical protein